MTSVHLREPYIRLAKPQEFDEIAELTKLAFIQDPVYNYFGSVQHILQRDVDSPGSRNIKIFVEFLMRACHTTGGRITIAIVTEENGSGQPIEKIAAAAFWLPPNKRLALWKVYTLIRCGVIKAIQSWGLIALKRIGFEYLDVSHAACVKGYKAKGLKESPDESWYLQQIMTHPDYQGKGLMSLLMREAYAYAPANAVVTLEATTAKSRDQYLHLGFEIIETIILGAGQVDRSGLPATKQAAVGVECYSMANWNPRKT